MRPADLFNAFRSKKPAGAPPGAARTHAGQAVELVLYKFDSCPFCQVVFRAVERLGVPLRYRDIEEDEAAARELVERGGLDQVPCLFVDGRPLYESADIVRYLERHFGPA